jgi:hypothetical protein
MQAGPTPAQQAAALAQANAAARALVLNQGVDMWQQVYQTSFAASNAGLGQQINVPIRNVGLIKRFVVEIVASVAQGAAETQTLQAWGPANFFSNIAFQDLSNQVRINTAGWHVHALATARRQWAFGSAYTNDSPVSIKNNFNVITAPSSLTTVQTLRMFYEIPISYSDFDLRGGIYAAVVNATMQLQLTINPNFWVASTATDPTLAVYKSSTAQLGTMTNLTITVFQNYLDQLPMGKNGPVLPIQDLSVAYLIQNTTVSNPVVGQDLPIPYANFRNFMSTFAIYDNNGTLNVGSDINYWAISSANFTNIRKYDPFLSSLLTREIINDDFPAGTYYFDHRQKPISTIQYGNMQLIVNPSNVGGAGSIFLVGYEALAQINQITQAGSLYGT